MSEYISLKKAKKKKEIKGEEDVRIFFSSRTLKLIKCLLLFIVYNQFVAVFLVVIVAIVFLAWFLLPLAATNCHQLPPTATNCHQLLLTPLPQLLPLGYSY